MIIQTTFRPSPPQLTVGSVRSVAGWPLIARGDTTRPATGTILASPGGPGAALPSIPLLQQVLGPVLERQNLLVVDPRGWGQSDPLLCPGLELDDPTAVAACAEHLGPRLTYYTADQAVADMDAVARRSPYNMARPAAPKQQGLRGGTTRWDRETSTITLDAVRFVDDLVVSGTVRIAPDHTVAAEMVATGRDGRARDLTLEWRAFVAEDETAVSGILDGAAFTGRVPQH